MVSGFTPLHPTHAIEQVGIQIAFQKEIPDADFASVARWRQLRLKLESRLPAFNQEPGIRAVAVGTPQARMQQGVVAINFARVGPDGAPSRILRLEPRSISYWSTEYTRWPSLRDEALDVINAASEECYFSNSVSIVEMGLQYSNRFIWNGEKDRLEPSQLIRQDSPWITQQAYRNTGSWHCHCGEFQRRSQFIRRLVHVNTMAATQETLSESVRYISLQVLLTDALNVPGYDRMEPLSVEESKGWILERLEDLHSSEKLIVAEVIVPSMQDRITLEPGITP